MAGTRTNSNSMTAIFIVALNNKKSGFRTEFFRTLGLDDDGTIFYDGTHSSVDYQEINGKQVDIIGRLNGQITFLMEVKVGINEDVQASQAKSGEYEAVYNAHKNEIKRLIYIIPDDYSHIKELPAESNGIKIINWSDILQMAKEFDNSNLENYIEQFVDLPLNSTVLLEKGEIYMLANPKAYVAARKLDGKILELARKFADGKKIFKTKEQNDDYGIGCYYSLKNNEDQNIFVGLNPSINKLDYCFALAVYKDLKCKKIEDCYNDGEYTYYSLLADENYEDFVLAENEEEQQFDFNKMVLNTMKKAGLING